MPRLLTRLRIMARLSARLPCQHLRHLGGAADERNQVFGLQTLLLHAEADGLYRAGQTDGKGFFLVQLNERGEQFKLVSLRRAGFGVEDGFHASERRLVVGVCFDQFGRRHTVCALISSYSRCVPKNRM